jgi:hypothetical protein
MPSLAGGDSCSKFLTSAPQQRRKLYDLCGSPDLFIFRRRGKAESAGNFMVSGVTGPACGSDGWFSFERCF